MAVNRFPSTLRKWSRTVHRELSFFFGGVLLIYAVSGFMLNHKGDFNADYDIRRTEYRIGNLPEGKEGWNKAYVLSLLDAHDERDRYTKHYFPDSAHVKVFLRGGSSLEVDTRSGQAVYESIRKRPLWSGLNRLHYNPGRWWTVFSDIFAFSLIVITISGLIMLKGPKGFVGRGGIEFLAGIVVPVVFLLFF